MSREHRQRERMDPEMADALRKMTGSEKLRVASGMYSAARRMLASHLGSRHPDWSEEAVQKEVARRLARGTG